MKHENQSFTLIEILVVIVIIGILSSFIFFTINDSVEKAQIAKSKMFSESIRNNLLLNLVSEYDFNRISGTINQALADSTLVADEWGSNNLYTTGGPFLKDGNDCIDGKCLDFINDSATNLNRIYANSGFDFSSSNFTISYWLNKRGSCRYTSGNYYNSSFAGIIEIINASTGDVTMYHAIMNGDEFVINLCFEDGTSTGDNYLDMGKNILNDWHLIIFSYYNNKLKAYIDGKIFYDDLLGAGKTLRTSSNMRVSIGKLTTYWTKGKMDEVQIYDAAISEAQIKQNYLAGLNNLYAKELISETEYNNKVKTLSYE